MDGSQRKPKATCNLPNFGAVRRAFCSNNQKEGDSENTYRANATGQATVRQLLSSTHKKYPTSLSSKRKKRKKGRENKGENDREDYLVFISSSIQDQERCLQICTVSYRQTVIDRYVILIIDNDIINARNTRGRGHIALQAEYDGTNSTLGASNYKKTLLISIRVQSYSFTRHLRHVPSSSLCTDYQYCVHSATIYAASHPDQNSIFIWPACNSPASIP